MRDYAVFLALLSGLAASACTDGGADGDEVTDVMVMPSTDGQVGTMDAGVGADGNGPLDSGPNTTADAARDTAIDAAPQADQGNAPMDTLDTLLDDWFADYNAGQGLEYLDSRGEEFADGDPETTRLPAHRYYRAVPYGPFSRNRLDLWRPEAQAPTPAVVYIHGGGFINGEREGVRNGNTLRRFLTAGIAVASISYRWSYRDPAAARGAPRPNDVGETHDQNGTRLDYILRDCARAVQYLRYRADEWNIDVGRMGAWGGSAGAGCVMWTASVPDLAQPDHADPVLRQSSRLQVAGHNNGQVNYNFLRWAELLGFDADWMFSLVGDKMTALTHMTREELTNTSAGQHLSTVMDYHAHLSADDPPFITTSAAMDTPMAEIMTAGQIIHHVRGHVALYERCQEVGMTCAINTPVRMAGFDGDVISYLMAHLLPE